MTTAAEATGAPTPIPIDGVEYLVSPLNAGDLGAIDNWLRAQVVAGFMGSLPPDIGDAEYDRAATRAWSTASRVTFGTQDGMRLLQTMPGVVLQTWLGMVRTRPSITKDEVMLLLVNHQDCVPLIMKALYSGLGMHGEPKKKR